MPPAYLLSLADNVYADASVRSQSPLLRSIVPSHSVALITARAWLERSQLASWRDPPRARDTTKRRFDRVSSALHIVTKPVVSESRGVHRQYGSHCARRSPRRATHRDGPAEKSAASRPSTVQCLGPR